MPRILVIAMLLLPSGLSAQIAVGTYGPLYTPEIHLGSAYEPSTVRLAPIVIEVGDQSTEPIVSETPPASTELLASRHFDFIASSALELVSPHGNMADSTISLGEYARQLRSRKRTKPTGSNHP